MLSKFRLVCALVAVALGGNVYVADTYNNRGVAKETKGHIDQAIENYKKAIELDPKHTSAHNNLGVALRVGGDIDGAIAHYNRALEIVPGFADVYFNRGIAWKIKGDLRQAVSDMKKALSLRPQDKKFQGLLAYLESIL